MIVTFNFDFLMNLIRDGAIEVRNETVQSETYRISIEIKPEDQARCRRLLERLLDGGI